MYAIFFKRIIDFILSVIACIVLLPLFLILTITGAIVMKGNPFFIQRRPGKIDEKTGQERSISLIKFRTMTNAKDSRGKLLLDEKRLVPYGQFLRSTSLDELPSIWNIVKGNLAICGPRPLLMEYLPRYSLEQRRRHKVRPGLTGYAQAYGRNSLTWEEKFEKDIFYVDHISLWLDIKIVFKTVVVVLKREGISSENSVTMEEFVGTKNNTDESVRI
ncbi:MAG: sugar transferase [Hespellia sp.]|nr:sugar transferase [Hespellia sp.]